MTKTATCTYHFLIMSWYIYLNYYISKSAEDPRKAKIFQNGGQWKYLTFLNLAIFFGVACLDDVLKRITRKKDIKIITACRDLLFTSMAFPMSMVVFLLFWAIFLYDRELVYPKTLDGLFSGWLNHAMHTLIMPVVLVEFFLRPYRYPSKKRGLTVLSVASLAYIGRVLWLYHETGTWVYPVFYQLSPVGVVLLFSIGYILVIGTYLLGEKFNHMKWGRFDADTRTQVPQEEKLNLQELSDTDKDKQPQTKFQEL